jgi:outer membrane protein OmpA-like peptidoglycan-associated protein
LTVSFPLRPIALALVAALTLTACETMDERSSTTAKGAGIGAASGAIIGGMSNNKNGVGRGAVIGAAIGAIGGNIWSRKMEAKRAQMEEATKDTGVAVTRTDDNQLKLEVPSDISFDTGSATIQPRLRGVLEQFATGLQHDPKMLVRVVGHTDSRGSEAVNNPLSKARAESVRGFLEDRAVAAHRIEIVGRGENEPIASNDTEEGRARNRRVEIFLREPEDQKS